MKIRWRYGIAAGIFLAIFSLYPQFKMLYLRGADWNGHYAYNDIDEVAYASYLKALIDGRPRKNDPYTGRDDSLQDPQPESLFSIQFAGPYTVAIPARVLGVGAPWAMTISGAVAAFLTALAIFWLIGMVTRDSLYAMADALIVLAGGALFAGEGAIGEILGTSYSYPYFPGFRRYIPAMAFPAFFLLVGAVWKMLADEPENGGGRNDISKPFPLSLVIVSSLAFGYTVFTYFFVWTTAAAWLGCVGICWLIVRPEGFGKDLKIFFGLGLGCLISLIPYAVLLSKRSQTMDDVQMLVRTHAPDLNRVPEFICFAVLAMIAAGVIIGLFSLKERATLFTISLALAPIAVFNQQIITGQSLQPIHYQVFIGNYVAGLALVMVFALIWRKLEAERRRRLRPVIAGFAVIAAAWGFIECHYTVRVLDEVNVVRDEALPVGRRLAELAKDDPDAKHSVVLNLGIAEADDLPTLAPQSVLWARHQHVFAGVTWDENKERYYQLLCYEGIGAQQLADGMKRGEDFVSMIAIFGWGRHTDRLNSNYKPLSFGEIDEEARRYDEYCSTFSPAKPGAVKLDYLVLQPEQEPYTTTLDRWYERDAGEVYGKYILYKLKPRGQ